MARGDRMARPRPALVDRRSGDCVEQGYLLVPAMMGQEARRRPRRAPTPRPSPRPVRGALRRGRPARARAPPAGPRADQAGAARRRLRAARRDHGRRHLRRAVADRHRPHLLQRDRGVPAGLRAAARPRVDDRTDAVVRRSSPTWSASPVGAWCTAPRSCSSTARGRMRWRRRGWPAERFAQVMHDVAAGEARVPAGRDPPAAGRLRGGGAGLPRASRRGWEPQPGLALLRLAQGDGAAAATAIRPGPGRDPRASAARRRSCRPTSRSCSRWTTVAAARSACRELERDGGGYGSGMLAATVAHAAGAVALAEGDGWAALVALRQAARAWQELDVPYEAARVRVLIGLACRGLGDEETAVLELQAARLVFAQLGAAPDIARVDALSGDRRAPQRARAVAARARGAAPGRRRCHEPGDRRVAGPERAHRGAARQQHLRQAARLLARCGHGVRVRARAGLSPRCVEPPTAAAGRRLGCSPDVAARVTRPSCETHDQRGGHRDHAGTGPRHSQAWNAIARGYDEFVTPTHLWLGNEALARAGIEPGQLVPRCRRRQRRPQRLGRASGRTGRRDRPLTGDARAARGARAPAEGLRDVETRVMDGHALEFEDDSSTSRDRSTASCSSPTCRAPSAR